MTTRPARSFVRNTNFYRVPPTNPRISSRTSRRKTRNYNTSWLDNIPFLQGQNDFVFQILGICILTFAIVLSFQNFSSLSKVSATATAKDISQSDVQILVNFSSEVGAQNSNKTSPLQEIKQPEPQPEPQVIPEREYVVQKDDSLYSISQEFGIDMASLAEYNQIEKPYTLSLGQKLKIPSQIVQN